MSLILKGIDLPSKGDVICLEIYSDGSVWDRSNWEPHRPKVSAIQIPKDHGNIIDDQSIEEAEIFDGSRIMKWSRDDRDNHNVLFIRSTTLLEAEE